jgi:hypothetical protein
MARNLFAPRKLLLGLLTPAVLLAQFTTQLAPQTSKEFDEYRKAAEAKMDWRAQLSPQPGDVSIAPGSTQSLISVSGGLIHDWRAATIARGATVEQVLAVLQDYPHYKDIYAPEVVDAKVLSHTDDRWRVSMRIVKKKMLTVTLDSEYSVENRRLDGGRWAKISRSDRLTEVSGGTEMPEGVGHGFLWSLNSYWLLEPRPDGVYIECRSISLSRDIPVVLDWIIRPMVTSLPRESLRAMLDNTVRAIKPVS